MLGAHIGQLYMYDSVHFTDLPGDLASKALRRLTFIQLHYDLKIEIAAHPWQ
ncbi:MAG: hypothetical protein JWO80_2775 [Bryobacterales bacterium]|nr:hypothetical protein [Bryobacterales bacterium]